MASRPRAVIVDELSVAVMMITVHNSFLDHSSCEWKPIIY